MIFQICLLYRRNDMRIKKGITILVLILSGYINTIAQQTEKTVYEKRQSVISVGYGIGNIWKSFLKEAISFPGITYKVTTTGPLTLIYEYGFSKRISGGVALAYSQVKGKYSGYGDEFIDKLTIFSALARANYHFGKWNKFDPYAGAGVGYVHSKYSNDQSATRNKVPGTLGYSGQLGARYYFSTAVAGMAEAGYVGGSFVQLGLSVKF